MGLPKEIQSYRNIASANYLYKSPPRLIRYKWESEIEPTKLYNLGEKGADIYLRTRPFNEKNLVLFALYAESKQHNEIANGFWKHAYIKSTAPSARKRKASFKENQTKEAKSTKTSLSFHELLFSIVREQRKYACHAIFLTLPSNKEANSYIKEYYDELQVISKPNTLIMITGGDFNLRTNMGDKNLSVGLQEEYSKIIQSFHVDFTMLPCMIIFESINSLEGVPIFLKGLSIEEITENMKTIFTIINKAVKSKISPISALQNHKRDTKIKNTKKEVIGVVAKILDYPLKIFIQEHIKYLHNPMSFND